MSENKWHWQTGRIWRGVGIYHVTMVVPSRMPLLGDLIIPNNDPEQAYVARKELGDSDFAILSDAGSYTCDYSCATPDEEEH